MKIRWNGKSACAILDFQERRNSNDRSLCGIQWHDQSDLPGTKGVKSSAFTCPDCQKVWAWVITEKFGNLLGRPEEEE